MPGLLLSKLTPPPVRSQTLRRPDLLEQLDTATDRRLVIVAAPAGYGKTTLLSTWVTERAGDHRVCWLTLDDGDNDPTVLWSHLITALQRSCPELGDSVVPAAIGPGMLGDVVLPRLVNALAALPAVTVVLDDFHLLSSAASRDSVAWFLHHAPAVCHLVISTRTEPGLPLAALRAHGDLVEIRSNALRFTLTEGEDLLNRRLGLHLASPDVGRLVERTEGWPAGLYLAALSMGDAGGRHAFVAKFDASNRHVLDFLVDDVLVSYPPAMLEFMLRTSVLDRFCAPLCEAVTGETGAITTLQELARINLFLVPLDDRGEWYRFHQLFAQLLTVELTRRAPNLIPTLHLRASAWHQQHGTIDEAVKHALDAGDLAAAGSLIEGAWVEFGNACRFETVRGWLHRFPPTILRSHTRLLMVQAWILSMCGRRAEAARVVAMIERGGDLTDGPLPDGFGSIESSLTMLRAVFPAGDIGSQLEHGKRASVLEGPESPWHPAACWAVGMGLYFQGELAEADRSFDDAFALAVVCDQWIVADSALAYRSLIAGETGRPDDQRILAERSAGFAADYGLEDVVGEVHLAVGLTLAGAGKIDDALPQLERAVLVLRAWGQPIDVAHALLHLASVLVVTDDDRITATLTEARSIIDTCPNPGVLSGHLQALEREHTWTSMRGEALTERELAVLRLLAGPGSKRDIAAELFVSVNTVNSQVRSIYQKLGVAARAAAVGRARSAGLIDPVSPG